MWALQIAYAVGKPPMAKIMDVFGRAEGVVLAAIFYFLGVSPLCGNDQE